MNSNKPKCDHAPTLNQPPGVPTLCRRCMQKIRWSGVDYALAPEPVAASEPTTEGHRAAIAAMYLYGEAYAAQRSSAEHFWHHLSEPKKLVCRNLVRDIERHQPEPGFAVQEPE